MEAFQQEVLDYLDSQVFIIEEHMTSKKEYKKWVDEIYDMIKKGFEIKEFRTHPVHFKFQRESETLTLEFRHFLTNLMIWEGFMRLEMQSEMNKTHILDCTNITEDTLCDYFNEKIVKVAKKRLPRTKKGMVKLNHIMDDITFNLSRISTDFNIILGLSVDIYSLIDLARKNERFNEIINTKIDEDMQPSEIEHMLDNLMNEETQILIENDNCLTPFLSAKSGIKTKQLREFSINGGLKPNLYGNTIPIPINSNFLVGGLKNIVDYVIDGKGGRKAAIMSKQQMGISGHFASTVILLSSGVCFSHNEDCGTLYPIRIFIDSMFTLKKFIGRYYKRYMSDKEYKLLTFADKDLINTEIYVRSPITCADEKGVCKMCYGSLYDVNKDLVSPGALSAIKITMPISQDVLSSKHLLTTNSVPIEFNEEFYNYFKISSNYIMIDDSIEDELDNYSLIIANEDLILVSEFDENEYNHFAHQFYVSDKDGNMTLIKEVNDNSLYLDKNVFKAMKVHSTYREIKFSKIFEFEKLFVVEIRNNELTKPLYEIKSLLDLKSNPNRSDIDTMTNMMIKLMQDSRINLPSIHMEMIISPLVRCNENILLRPNFASYGAENYTILTVKDALEHHPSSIIGISFQQLKRQLTKQAMTYNKTSKSIFDQLYKAF